MSPNLVLASSSPYRATLLKRLGVAFVCIAPEIDETPNYSETIDDYIKRLSIAKAQAAARLINEAALIIASDQSATYKGEIIGKPLTKDRAIEQLLSFSGQSVTFKTGVCVLNSESGNYDYALAEYSVKFRTLSRDEVARYVEKDNPLDCAGSFKCESLGVALFESMSGDDPTSLEGLPLIKTCKLLHNHGFDPLKH